MGFEKAFDKAEYLRRIADVKTRMDDAGFDLLICQDPANMGWLTGFDGWSFYTPQAVALHQDEEWPIWFGREQDAKSAHITTDLPASNIIPFSEPLVHHATRHPFDELCDLIKSRGWANARIGVDFDAHYYTARAHGHLIAGLPDAKIGDNRELVNWARLVKSPAELVYMREAGQICTRTMQNALDKLAPGVPQYEVIADVYHDQVTGIGGKFGDYTSLCPLIQVGEGTSTPHLTWTDEPLPDSGLIVMELGAARRHYHAPLTRTAHIGPPPPDMAKLAAVIVEGGDRAMEIIDKAIKLDPLLPVWCVEERGIALFGAGKYQEAISALNELPFQSYRSRLYHCAALMAMSKSEDARRAMQLALVTNNELTATWFMRKECWRDLDKRDQIKSSLIEAGLPR